MKDEEFVMKEDIRERKQMAIGAKHMNRRGKRPINMGVEYKSDKEINEMHGEMKQYDLSKPMSYQEFKMMPADLQGEYFRSLYEKHGATQERIMVMWKVGARTVAFLRKQFHISATIYRRNPTEEASREAKWLAFLNSGNTTEETPKKTVNIPEKEKISKPTKEPMRVSDAFFRVTGTPEDIYALLKSVTSGERRTYEISLMEEVRE